MVIQMIIRKDTYTIKDLIQIDLINELKLAFSARTQLVCQFRDILAQLKNLLNTFRYLLYVAIQMI